MDCHENGEGIWMFNKAVYNQTKALIGYLETRLEKLEKDEVSDLESQAWSSQTEDIWNKLCRRTTGKRGPYERRTA